MNKSELIAMAGSASALAGFAGVTKQAVGQWPENKVPAERVIPICRGLMGCVTPYEIRPDIYPDPGWLPPVVRASAEKAA